MKVDIQHEEAKTGLVFKKPIYKVHCTVIFSEEEKHIIKKEKLTNETILDRPPYPGKKADPAADRLYVNNLLRGKDTFAAETITEAKKYEETLIRCLQGLKAMITKGTEISEKTKSFEL